MYLSSSNELCYIVKFCCFTFSTFPPVVQRDNNMRAGHSCCWIVSFLLLIPFATSSSGDASETFKDHFRLCRNDHCSSLFMVNEFEKVQPFYLRLLGWDCIEECKHISMWQTVENLQQKNLEIPQFFGKVGNGALFNVFIKVFLDM